MLLLPLGHGNSSGCHNATPTPNFLYYSLLWVVGIMLLLRLSQVFLQGATISTLHPKNLDLSLRKGDVMLLLRLSQVFLQGATMPPLHPKKFLDLSLLREGAFCFCFDLARVFIQGATMPTLNPKIIFGFVIMGKR